MKAKNSKNIRVDVNFDEKMIKDIQMKKMKKQGKFITPRRITLAMTRHRLMPQVKRDIVEADIV